MVTADAARADAAGSARPYSSEIFFAHRQQLATFYAELFDRRAHGYREFVLRVAEHTKPGDRIAIVVPMRRWDEGYS